MHYGTTRQLRGGLPKSGGPISDSYVLMNLDARGFYNTVALSHLKMKFKLNSVAGWKD